MLERLAFPTARSELKRMADCPGMVHLAAMADGGLARLRAPGGALTSAQLRAVAGAAETLGSGAVDLTNRANLQIRGLAAGAGPALVGLLEAAGFRFHGEADRRRNILLDPFSGLDPAERRDMRPLGEALDRALVAAPWIAGLSPKFSFVLDGGGRSCVGAVTSDVVAVAADDRIVVFAGGRAAALVEDEAEALAALLALAEAAADAGPSARARDLWADKRFEDRRDVSEPLPLAGRARVGVVQDGAPAIGIERRHPLRLFRSHPHPRPLPARGREEDFSLPAALTPRFGVAPTAESGVVAVSLAVPVGRLDPTILRLLADMSETAGDRCVRLAPWSGLVLPGVAADEADAILEAAEAAGFTPVDIAERLSVVACAGAPACERASEPAKALGAAVLALAAREPERLPQQAARLHLSACSKGCAGSAPADLLLLGETGLFGWSVHHGGAPRRPGAATGRLESAEPEDVLALLGARR